MSERSFYLSSGGEAVFATHHVPVTEPLARRGVLLLPPYGWEELATHRARREWALHLAAGGYHVLRIDLPGTGDSEGDLAAPGRWAAWEAAARRGASWLRRDAELARLSAIGLGSGGFLALALVADGGADEAVAWGMPATGKRFLRELGAFGVLEASRVAESGGPPPPSPVAGIEAGGHVLGEELAAALRAVDPAAVGLPQAARVLLAGRDGAATNAALAGALRAGGADVETCDGNGYGAMVVQPDQSVAPREVFAAVSAWLDRAPVEWTHGPRGAVGPARAAASSALVGGVRESPIEVELPRVRLRAVLTRPETADPLPLSVLFLNAGAIRRTGPNRLWVTWARRFAARGLTSVRLDLEGIGDSDGDGERYRDVARFHDPELLAQVPAAVDALVELGLPPRFVAVGLCSGAYWAYRAALADERVAAALMINPRVLDWHERLESARDLRRTRLLVRPVTWKRLLRGDVPVRRWKGFARWVAAGTAVRLGFRDGAAEPSVLEWQALRAAAAFSALRDAGRRAHFVFCDGEPLRDELTEAGLLDRRGRWPNVSCRIIPGREHTLKPVWMHPFATRAVEEALAQEIALAQREAASVA